MRESLALGMVIVGALIAVIGPIGAGIAVLRLVDAQRVLAGNPTNRRAATFDGAYWMLLFAVVTSAGLLLLVLGGAIGFGLAGWAPVLPGGMLVLAAIGAGYARWELVRLRSSR
jgi:hypothetical protein